MKPLVIANWKMNKTVDEALLFVRKLKEKASRFLGVEIWIAPPFVSIGKLSEEVSQSSLRIGAQNVASFQEGAYTGEVSARMLKSCGASFVLIGHSERRSLFLERAPQIGQKILRAIDAGLCPVLCVGEHAEEREQGQKHAVLKAQIETALFGVPNTPIVIAYEPVWAIGTGVLPDKQEIESTLLFCLEEALSLGISKENVRLLYGGSVNPEVAFALIQGGVVQGVLVGGASLDVSTFCHLIEKVIL